MDNKYSFPSVDRTGLSLILGLGETGVAASHWCAFNGAKLRLADTRPALLEHAEVKNIKNVESSRFSSDVFEDASLLNDVTNIILSPGLNPNEVVLAKLLDQARSQDIKIIGEIELFAQAINDLKNQDYQPLIFAVTGTNGKTTVSSLLGHLLNASGIKTRVAGNIGPAALASLLEAIELNDLPQAWVLELSSFQLHTTSSLMADAAVVLNISQDHIDWHGSIENYIQDKAKLYAMAKISVVNRSDNNVLNMVSGLDRSDVRSFGNNKPSYVGDFGLSEIADTKWLAVASTEIEDISTTANLDNSLTRHKADIKNIMPAAALPLIGQHNIQNVLAALTMLKAAGLSLTDALYALRTYKGQAHRTEFIRTIAGVDFIDDSKGTNVGATVAALAGIDKPIVLIAGGLGKGQDFTDLAVSINENVKAVYLIGKDAKIIADSLTAINSQVPVEFCSSLEQAVNQGFAAATAGDVVLLSPACASLDMFKNYIQRGQCFMQAIQEIALDHGEFA